MTKTLYDATKEQFTSSTKEIEKLRLALSYEKTVNSTFTKIVEELKVAKSAIFIIDFLEEFIFAIDGHPQGVEDFNIFVDTFRKEHGEKQLALLIKVSDIVMEKLKKEYIHKIDFRTFKIIIALIKARMFDEIRRNYAKSGRHDSVENGNSK